MTHRTKLYQQARSPLIQGRSKIERPMWESAIAGGVLAFAVWAAMLAGDVAGNLTIFVNTPGFELIDLVPAPALALLGAAVLGGYLGSGLALGMGWHKGWKTAFVVAFVADIVAYLIVL
jgi:hypothetical protein